MGTRSTVHWKKSLNGKEDEEGISILGPDLMKRQEKKIKGVESKLRGEIILSRGVRDGFNELENKNNGGYTRVKTPG